MVTLEIFDQDFQKAIARAQKQVSDLRIPFKLITDSWFKGNRAIFALKGPGKYVDLTPNYKKRKAKRWGFTYPILRASGRLESSITKPGDAGSVAKVINRMTLVIGTTVPYAAAHQYGLGNVPVRPMILLGAEQTAPEELNNRREAWVSLIAGYVRESLEGSGLGEPK